MLALLREQDRSRQSLRTNERREKEKKILHTHRRGAVLTQPLFIDCGGKWDGIMSFYKTADCCDDEAMPLSLEVIAAATSHAVGVNLLGSGDLVQNRLNFV